MAAEVCCATWNGHPRHSRQSIFPHLKRGSFLHGVKLSQLRNNKQAPAGHSRLCCLAYISKNGVLEGCKGTDLGTHSFSAHRLRQG
ncbi:hypothetical protein WJX82_006777 [Trebouxia sp. C0006]